MGVNADDTKLAAKTEPWKPEDVIYQEFVFRCGFHRRKWLVWIKPTG
jgi:hypothetical protein